MLKPSIAIALAALTLTGCGRLGDSASALNPARLFSPSERTTLEPKEGYQVITDQRPGIPTIIGARWEPLEEGRLLVATARTPTSGYFDIALVPQSPGTRGRLSPDADGVLRLRYVGRAPIAGSQDAARPARPEIDDIEAAVAVSNRVLAQISAVEITGASNIVRISR